MTTTKRCQIGDNIIRRTEADRPERRVKPTSRACPRNGDCFLFNFFNKQKTLKHLFRRKQRLER